MSDEIPMDERPLLDDDDDNNVVDDDWNNTTERETAFTTPYETPKVPRETSVLSREITRQKIDIILRKLGVDGDVGVNIDRFRTRLNEKSGISILEFDRSGVGEDWVNLTNKRTGEPLKASTIKNVFGGIAAMKNLLGIEETPAGLAQSMTEAKQLRDDTPTEIEMQSMSNEEVLDSVSQVSQQIREISTNTDLDMREFDGIDRALQRMSGELKNNLSKLSSVEKHLKYENKKLKEIENDPSYTEEQRQEVQERISRLKEEHEARLELVSQNKKTLSSQFARIKQTIEKILDGDMTLGEKIKLVFREQGITIIAVLTALGLIIETIVQAFTGGSRGSGKPPPKDEKGVRKWFQNKLKALANLLGKLASKAAAALPGIIGAIVSAILNFLKKTVTFLAEHTWALIVGIASFAAYEVHLYLTKKKH